MESTPEVRVSDAEREAVVELLRRGYGEGRLTLEEYDERTDLALAARVRSELDRLTADLPAPEGPTLSVASAPGGRAGGTRWTVAVMGGSSRKGRWRPAARSNVVAVMGGCDLDLREADLAGTPEIVITAVAVMGGIEVVVPEGVPVELTGLAIMGGKDSNVPPTPARPGVPVVRVRAFALMGGVDVKLNGLKRGRRALQE